MILASTIVAGVLTLLYLIFLCCQFKNIAIGADIMSAAGEFVSMNPRIVMVPIVSYCFVLPIALWYAVVNAFLYSTGEPKFVKKEMFALLENKKDTETLFWLFMFGFFWVVAFIIAIG